MRERPRGRHEDENGVIIIDLGSVDKTPEYPEVIAWDKEFADECDKLSEIDATKTGKKHWGRWYRRDLHAYSVVASARD